MILKNQIPIVHSICFIWRKKKMITLQAYPPPFSTGRPIPQARQPSPTAPSLKPPIPMRLLTLDSTSWWQLTILARYGNPQADAKLRRPHLASMRRLSLATRQRRLSEPTQLPSESPNSTLKKGLFLFSHSHSMLICYVFIFGRLREICQYLK